VCGPAINDAPSYRAAKAPLGREVQREVLIPRCRIARPGAAPLGYGIGELRTDGPSIRPEDTTLLDYDLMGRDLRRRGGVESLR
jgi:hypothetical protein